MCDIYREIKTLILLNKFVFDIFCTEDGFYF